MAHVTEKDFQKLAGAVADDLIQQDISLNDSITKLAASMDLSHEQVRRLCEATNNVAFNKMFNARDKTASDRIVEFPVADPKVVLESAIKEASAVDFSKTAAYELRPLRDEMQQVRHPEPAPESFTKVAFELRPQAQHSDEKDRRTMAKVLDNMRHQKLAADMAYLDGVVSLRGQFRRLYDVVPFAQFEKAAAARFGDEAVGPLNEIREMMKLPQVDYNISRLIKVAGFVDDTTTEMQLLQQILSTQANRTKLAQGIAKIEGVL
jgi:hypothetical protein